jgi:hypothetical protein
MPKNHGTTLTRLFVTSGWHVASDLISKCFQEFTGNGWEERHNKKNGFRCLTMFDADLSVVRKASKKNPALIFLCVTMSCETNDTTLTMGIGGAWLKKTRRLSREIRLGAGVLGRDYVRTLAKRQPTSRPARRSARKPEARDRGSSDAITKQPRTKKAPKAPAAVQVANKLVFHGLPAEVEQCRALVLEMLSNPHRTGATFTTEGNDRYVVGSMGFMTDREPAFRVFNRLLAKISGVTVTLEYADPKSGQPRKLRAVDGRIVGQQMS